MKDERPNILLITVDDMNYDSPGVTGSRVHDITPSIDHLASEGLRFVHSHVNVAVCQPARQCLMTGRYPHNNGAPGFDPIGMDVPTLQEQLHAAGYVNGILGKVGHLAPIEKFCWTTNVDAGDLGRGRSPQRYYEETKAFIEQAKAEGNPFFLMANSHDPHRPFAGSDDELRKFGEPCPVSRTYQPEEVEVPGFLPDIPDVRKEIAQYFTSVRRCDDTVGEVLRALHESGLEQNTLVMFLSDNGMAFPFAKTNCYLASTRTPWIVRWPGKVEPGAVDQKNFISAIDFMPTILDVAGLPTVEGMDGRSFLPCLRGEEQKGRDAVFTLFNTTAGRRSYPMRCIQNRRYGYIFNAWPDGETEFKNESQAGLTMKAMREAAEHDAAIAARVKFFLYRVPEEFYDFENDPCALNNLIEEEGYQDEVNKLRLRMRDTMAQSSDPLLSTFERQVLKTGG